MSAYIRYPEAVACFYATSSYIADPAPLIEVNCENMTLRIEELNVTCFHKNGDVAQIPVEGKKGYGKSYWGAGHEDCITDFYDCLKNNRRFALDLTEMQSTIQLMLAAYESARSGREVMLGQ
jgi:predicted dehydrogenase